MENKYAILDENNIVTNIIEFEEYYNLPENTPTYDITCMYYVEIGWHYNKNDNKFYNKNYYKEWRNEELKLTDYIVPILDHSKRDLWLTYRQELRDWPSTADFPETKPTKPE